MAVVGPTAAGKSAVATHLAAESGAEILSVDSMQVYRGMDIGTAKPTPAERERVVHHMIDLVEPDEDFSVARFQAEARDRLRRATRPVIIVGGSGLHFRAVVDPLEFPPTDPELRAELEAEDPDILRSRLLGADPEAGDHVDLRNPRRVIRALEIHRLTGLTPSDRSATEPARRVDSYESLVEFGAVGIDPGEAIGRRVADRLDGMRRQGLVEEVRALEGRLGRTAAQAVGYKELMPVTRGEITEEEGFELTLRATLELVRAQRSFFRRDPRIEWLPWDDDIRLMTARTAEALEI